MRFDAPTTVYVVLDIIIALVVIVGNLFVISVILQSTSLRRKAMYMFVTSLAFADVCVGITAIPFGILTKFGLPYDAPSLCITMLSFIMISTQISIFNMMAIAVERYLAIRQPRTHYTKLTSKRAAYVIALTWVIASLVGCLPLLGWNNMSEFSAQENLPGGADIHFGSAFSSNSSTHNQSHKLTRNSHVNMDTGDHRHCRFMKIMDEDYMFFNFTVCVLPPLLTCAVLYFIIFLSLVRTARPQQQPLQEHNKCSYTHISSRTPVLQRKLKDKMKLRASYQKSCTVDKNKVKIVIDLQLDDSINSEGTPRLPNRAIHENQTPLSDSQEIVRSPLLARLQNKLSSTKGSPRLTPSKEHYDENVCSHLKLLALQEMRQNMYRCNYDTDSQTDVPNSGKSSYASTPVMRRSLSGNTLHWESVKKRKSHHSRTKKEVHAATVLGLIVLCFVICWLPIHVLNTVNKFNGDKTIYIPAWLYDVGVLLSHTNSAVNFFLYSWRLKAFRQQLHHMTLRKISR